MIPIPQDINTLYSALLIQKAVPAKYHPYYRKWLRYYLDFCQKYGFKPSDTKSLPHFIKKLKEKKQTDLQQKQAADAIYIYYGQETIPADKNVLSKTNNRVIPSKKNKLKPTNASWVPEYNDLNAEITIRHYSKSTLRTYTTWVRQFQGFTKSKDPKLLSTSDVKEFLTHLAVDKKVAASTQNQAFNALLFFYRHVLKSEFGDIKDVPRAKRKNTSPWYCLVKRLIPSFHFSNTPTV